MSPRLAEALLEKIKNAVRQRNSQVDAFMDYHSAIPGEYTAMWKCAVEDWEADHSRPNPFLAVRTRKPLAVSLSRWC